MNFNKLLLDKIDNLVILSKEFDENYKKIIETIDNNLDEKIINCIYTLTKNYISLRTIHGEIILLMNKYENYTGENIKKDDKDLNENSDNKINKLYDLSTFYSIITNINELINNIDFQYKKIATKYPKYIGNKSLTVMLLIDENEDENKNVYTQLINKVKVKYPENIYKIIKVNKKEKKEKKKNLDKILGINLTLKITILPTIYVINGTNIVELPLDKINNIEEVLENIFK